MYFDTPAVEEIKGFEALPPGTYRLMIDDIEAKPTKANDGQLLNVTFLVVEPTEFEGRKVWERFNIENKSAEAQRIGRGQFKRLLTMIGHTAPIQYENELRSITFGKKVTAVLGVETYNGNTKNVIKKYVGDDETPIAAGAGTVAPGRLDDIPF